MSSGILNIAKKAAYNAAKIIQHESRRLDKLEISAKSPKDYVTNIDKKAEVAIIDTILQAFPTHNILAEESGITNNKSNTTWIIDPIDGTLNFIHGHPRYSISIGIKQDGVITHGVILDPNRNDLYAAQIGKGAFLNDKRIRVSKTTDPEISLIATGFPGIDSKRLDTFLAIFREMSLKTAGHRREGSAALDLAYVACGIFDGFWEFNLKQWDFAAGVLLVKEAGGFVTDFKNTQGFWENGNILAANPKLFPHLIKIIQKHL